MPADLARRGAPQRSAFRLFAGLFRCCDLLTRVVGVLAILYVVAHLIYGYLDSRPALPTRWEKCGGTSRIPPQPWQGSEEQRRFDSALEAKQQWMLREAHSVVSGCSGRYRAVCFSCGAFDFDETCSFHDWRNNWSWPEKLRDCLVKSRPTDAFYRYVSKTSAFGDPLDTGNHLEPKQR